MIPIIAILFVATIQISLVNLPANLVWQPQLLHVYGMLRIQPANEQNIRDRLGMYSSASN